MRIRAGKFVVYAVAAALAAANGFAPRHAQGHQHPAALAVAGHHEHAVEQAGGDHHHAPQQAAKPCHDETDDPAPGSPLHNCCVASCSAAAFIFASFNFASALPDADYHVLPAPDLTQATLNSADPPPR